MKSKRLYLYICKKEIMLFVLFLFSLQSFSQKKYHKAFYGNGKIKEEGWLLKDKKTKYWKFYYKNGTLKKEGHFKNNLPIKYWYFYRKDASKEKEGHFVNGKQNKWWLYYDNDGNVNHKCQLKNDKKNGYCLLYKKQKLVKAVKFKNGKKINEWTDFSSFKKENSLKDLQ
ncbi:hypothetical protein [uncultured Tenacibaculum sp.]|uniref:toxin-antitoxin system YwqK family antitoxin n=1 Tax=uncultured Tenacibaculum sp. TaxID=174713 RepID=UPI002626B190|nr:hypothetical protein [uncultured Tenacibaculum sp.]